MEGWLETLRKYPGEVAVVAFSCGAMAVLSFVSAWVPVGVALGVAWFGALLNVQQKEHAARLDREEADGETWPETCSVGICSRLPGHEGPHRA